MTSTTTGRLRQPDPDHANVFGGRDLRQGGGWLMVSTPGRLAAVTNVRVGFGSDPMPRSRGDLVRGFVAADAPATGYLHALEPDALRYGRFNLLLWDGEQLVFATNHPEFSHQRVSPGIHVMSNGAFDAAWPKSQHATGSLSLWMDGSLPGIEPVSASTIEPLFAALADAIPAPDALLPDTGVGLAMERALSPPFVRGDVYGTRCSTVVVVEDTRITFAERRYDANAQVSGETFEVMSRNVMSRSAAAPPDR